MEVLIYVSDNAGPFGLSALLGCTGAILYVTVESIVNFINFSKEN